MPIAIVTPRLFVRGVRGDDAQELFAYCERNHQRLRPWEPDPPPGYFTLGYWERFAVSANDESESPSRLRLVALEPDAPGIVASVNLQTIQRDVLQRAVLGYSIDGAYEGKGYAREAVAAVVDFAFDTLRLHRVEANYQPVNERSANLLRSLGFAVEGYARDYLFLNGAWRDHILTARINPHP